MSSSLELMNTYWNEYEKSKYIDTIFRLMTEYSKLKVHVGNIIFFPEPSYGFIFSENSEKISSH